MFWFEDEENITKNPLTEDPCFNNVGTTEGFLGNARNEITILMKKS